MNTAVCPEIEAYESTAYKRQPLYAVIVLNDDIHTFQYVIEAFQKVFNYKLEKCHELAIEIHETGRSIVWTGGFELAELKMEQLKGLGPDFYAKVKCEDPLGVVIEQLP